MQKDGSEKKQTLGRNGSLESAATMGCEVSAGRNASARMRKLGSPRAV